MDRTPYKFTRDDDMHTMFVKSHALQKLNYLVALRDETIAWRDFDSHAHWTSRKRALVDTLCSIDIDNTSNDELFALYDEIIRENTLEATSHDDEIKRRTRANKRKTKTK